jgi:hypothetical protein
MTRSSSTQTIAPPTRLVGGALSISLVIILAGCSNKAPISEGSYELLPYYEGQRIFYSGLHSLKLDLKRHDNNSDSKGCDYTLLHYSINQMDLDINGGSNEPTLTRVIENTIQDCSEITAELTAENFPMWCGPKTEEYDAMAEYVMPTNTSGKFIHQYSIVSASEDNVQGETLEFQECPDGERHTEATITLEGTRLPDGYFETEVISCIPQCENRECGDDNCGGTCGTCSSLYPICNESGICENPDVIATNESVVPHTGGDATSADGLFSVIMGPFVFSETVTLKVETLETYPLGESRSLSRTYRVIYSPSTAEISPSANFRVQFAPPIEFEDIGLENISIEYKMVEQDAFSNSLMANYDENKNVIWASSPQLGDFGLINK